MGKYGWKRGVVCKWGEEHPFNMVQDGHIPFCGFMGSGNEGCQCNSEAPHSLELGMEPGRSRPHLGRVVEMNYERFQRVQCMCAEKWRMD